MLGRQKSKKLDWSSLHKFAEQLGDEYTINHYTCSDRTSVHEKIVIEYNHHSKKHDQEKS